MPKVVIDDSRGLIQEAGSGIDVRSAGLVGVADSGAATSLLRTGAGIAGALTVALPAGALILDFGVVVTTGITLSGGADLAVRVGTGADGQQLAAAANFISNNTTEAAGKSISLDASGEGAAKLAMVADAAMHSATARTIHITVRNSANNVTAGAAKGFVRYAIVK